MKDYALQIKIKNNYLLQMMKRRDIFTVSELSRQVGVTYTTLGKLLGLKLPAYGSSGKLLPCVTKLCEFFDCLPEDLFPEQHLQETLPINKVLIEANAEDLIPLSMRLASQDPLDLLIQEEEEERTTTLVTEAVAGLSLRDRVIIKHRYGLGRDNSATLKEVGERLVMSATRVKQLEARGLRKLQHPSRGLKELLKEEING
jgi:DNA-binding Xre family transcriptional regulator